jgi:hypothetical protein
MPKVVELRHAETPAVPVQAVVPLTQNGNEGALAAGVDQTLVVLRSASVKAKVVPDESLRRMTVMSWSRSANQAALEPPLTARRRGSSQRRMTPEKMSAMSSCVSQNVRPLADCGSLAATITAPLVSGTCRTMRVLLAVALRNCASVSGASEHEKSLAPEMKSVTPRPLPPAGYSNETRPNVD